jgi:hypothetical protein
MKYFTLEWWANHCDINVFDTYDTYINQNRTRILADLLQIYDEVSLHDARLRSMIVLPEVKTTSIELDGCRLLENGNYASREIWLSYSKVDYFKITADPNRGLAGPHGFGDLGYDEIEVIKDGLFEHRMIFSSGIEIQIRFEEFILKYADK